MAAWTLAHDNDPWRGITGVVQQPPSLKHDHGALLQLDINQYITFLTPPLWMWHSPDMISGEYAVGVATYHTNRYGLDNTDGAAQLGLVPLARLLNRLVASTNEV